MCLIQDGVGGVIYTAGMGERSMEYLKLYTFKPDGVAEADLRKAKAHCLNW